MISQYFLHPFLSACGALFGTLSRRSFFLLCICLLQTAKMAKSQDTLYAGKTNFVIEFDPQTAPFATVAEPRVVEFYSPMCPACVSFSPHYMKMAEITKKLYPNILFFGVSCDKYEAVCDEYGVEGYPTLRFFKSDDDPTSKGFEQEFEAEDVRDASTPGKIASLVNVNSMAATTKQIEPNTVVARPKGKTVNDPLDDSEKSKKYSSFFKTAKEQHNQKHKGFGLRFHPVEKGGKDVTVADYEKWTNGMKQNTPGTTEFRNRKKALENRLKKVNPRLIKKDTAQQQDNGDKKKFPLTKDVSEAKWYKRNTLNPEEELILDTTLSLVVSFESGLSMGITDVTSRSAMKQWLNLLSVSLPPEWNVHKLINSLKANFDYATQNKENFKEIVGTYKLHRKGWSHSCKNEELNSAGFTCGFWKLIHVITLGVAEERGGQNLIDSGDVVPTTQVFSPASAAETIRNYIDKFFTCKPCREHFLQKFDDCKNNRRCERLTNDQTTANPSDWKELAMYFWEFHNDVSVRLVGERIRATYFKGVRNEPTANDEVAVLFPNINTCLLCFDDTGAWNKAEVFGFLERTYWPDSEKDPLTDKLLKLEGESESEVWFLLLAMALVVGLVITVVQTVTGRQSYLIHQSLVTARQLVSSKSRTV